MIPYQKILGQDVAQIRANGSQHIRATRTAEVRNQKFTLRVHAYALSPSDVDPLKARVSILALSQADVQ